MQSGHLQWCWGPRVIYLWPWSLLSSWLELSDQVAAIHAANHIILLGCNLPILVGHKPRSQCRKPKHHNHLLSGGQEHTYCPLKSDLRQVTFRTFADANFVSLLTAANLHQFDRTSLQLTLIPDVWIRFLKVALTRNYSSADGKSHLRKDEDIVNVVNSCA